MAISRALLGAPARRGARKRKVSNSVPDSRFSSMQRIHVDQCYPGDALSVPLQEGPCASISVFVGRRTARLLWAASCALGPFLSPPRGGGQLRDQVASRARAAHGKSAQPAPGEGTGPQPRPRASARTGLPHETYVDPSGAMNCPITLLEGLVKERMKTETGRWGNVGYPPQRPRRPHVRGSSGPFPPTSARLLQQERDEGGSASTGGRVGVAGGCGGCCCVGAAVAAGCGCGGGGGGGDRDLTGIHCSH